MTNIEIRLPDGLVKEARKAGLLAPEAIEDMLRKRLKAMAAGRLFAFFDKINEENDPTYMSPEEVAEEIRAMRSGRRAQD